MSRLPLMMLFLGACASRPPAIDSQVRRIRFEDNGPWLSSRSDAALREAMGHPKPRGLWPLREMPSIDRNVLEEDRHRLAVHYAHNGYFDARVDHWEVKTLREANDKRPAVVAIIGHMAPGEPSEITEVVIEGTEELSAPAQAVVEERLKALEGAPAELARHDSAKADVERELGNLAFAQASVEGELLVDRRDRSVKATYQVSPGPVSTFGDVTIDGDEGVPTRVVRDRVAVEPGTAFNLDELDRTRNRLYGLGVFSTAQISPQIGQGTKVPVHIHLEQRKPRGISGGAGLELASGRQEALARFTIEHINAAHQLLDLRFEATAGYAVLAASLPGTLQDISMFRSGPTADLNASASLPVLGWQATLEAEYVRDITEAFVTDQPAGTLSFAGQLAEKWTLSLAYRLRYTRYTDVQVDPRQLAALEGAPDLVDGSYIDAHTEQTLIWDARDNALAPTRGWRHSVTLREAGRALGGDYDYLGASLDLRGYRDLGHFFGDRKLVLAGRIGGGYMLPYGPEERRAVPVAERLYLGGSGSTRGWIYQHLGPYICSLESDTTCSSQPGNQAPEDIDTVPVGGRVSSFGSLALRSEGQTFGGAVFTDLGMVWATPDVVTQIPILPSVGVGGRMNTPVGPLRLDVAARTDNLPMFRHEPRVWLHIGIGEAF